MLLVTLRCGAWSCWRQKALQDLLTLCLTVVLSSTITAAAAMVRFPRYVPAAALLHRPQIGRHVARPSFAELGCAGRGSHRDAVQQGGQSRGFWRRVLLIGVA